MISRGYTLTLSLSLKGEGIYGWMLTGLYFIYLYKIGTPPKNLNKNGLSLRFFQIGLIVHAGQIPDTKFLINYLHLASDQRVILD